MSIPSDKRVAQVLGVGGFGDSPDRIWKSATEDVEPLGSSIMSRILIIKALQDFKAIRSAIWLHSNLETSGWRIYRSTADSFIFYVADDGGISRSCEITIAPRCGEIFVLLGAYEANAIRLRVKGIENEVTGSWTGYTPRTTYPHCIGARQDGSLPETQAAIIAALATDAQALSFAQMQAIELSIISDLEQGKRIDISSLNAPVYYWDARDIHRKINGDWYNCGSGAEEVLKETGETQIYSIQSRFA